MIGLLELLGRRGLDLSARTKMVRHEDARYAIENLIREGQFEFYQGYQSRPIFDCKYVVSFLGQPHRRALFYGVYQVVGHSLSADRDVPPGLTHPEWAARDRFWYDLEKLSSFADLEQRVIIDWGASTRSWHQWLRDREVMEVLPTGYVKEFPGYLEFVLSYEELGAIVRNPVANREWHRMLTAVAGIYLIVDRKTGRQYVGSACGEGGILQRWAGYVQTGHGGNRLLQEVLMPDSSYVQNFDFTVLQTLPRTATPAEVVVWEQLHKRKLGSRAHGLNLN
jgi:hypothetical protein